MEPPGTRSRDWAVAACRTAGFEPNVAFEIRRRAPPRAARHAGPGRRVSAGLIATGAAACNLLPSGGRRAIRLALRSGSENNPAIAAARGALHAVGSALPS
ncbi:hypothetical protein GCM10009747_22880 [Agromyces humatus]|uniref:Uncharacterized protein n=1 Tax=Agromyces humatus TaxID=279573 RepID=A0ABP4WVR0_9MICO